MRELPSVWDLNRRISECQRCRLARTRTNVVPGEGPTDALVMFVGEAPGRLEDLRGRPFVGPAGHVLDELLPLAGLDRSKAFITSVLKCRPPRNRPPMDDEISACIGFLHEQITLIKPSIVCPLGLCATRNLYGRGVTMARAHGTQLRRRGLLLFPMYHPAVVLYKAPMRGVLARDMRRLGKLLSALGKSHS
ncbi:TPA: uracil-DNA glycosylase [Candidatus Bathyarchaeota archaeon]|nr:uracil-DNA glycosylase [Candidatus Bathyarchaeota archaeon]